MINFVKTSYNEVNKKYTFRGFFGIYFKNFISRKILTPKKTSLLFSKLGNTEIEIDSFFLLEFKIILEKILKNDYDYNLYVNLNVIEKILEAIKKDTWLNSSNDKNTFKLNQELIDNRFNPIFLDYQKRVFEIYQKRKNTLNQRGILLDADTGTGKTLMSMALNVGIDNDISIYVVMNQSIDTTWVNAFLVDKGNLLKQKYTKEDIYTSKEFDKEYNGQKIIICHSEALDKLINLLPIFGKTTFTITVDECHLYTDVKSIRTNLLLELIETTNCQDVILMSGTTIKGSYLEMMPYLKFLEKTFTKSVEKRYQKMYSKPTSLLKEVVQLRYGSISTKVEKKELNLKEVQYENIEIKMPNSNLYTLTSVKEAMKEYSRNRKQEIESNIDKYQATYDRLLKISMDLNSNVDWEKYKEDFKAVQYYYKKRILIQYPHVMKRVSVFEKDNILPYLQGQEKKDFKDASTILKYPSFKIAGEALGKVFMRLRMECHRDMAKHIDYSFINNSLGKAILFSTNIETIEAANDKMKKDGINYVTVFGKENKNIASVITTFIEDDNVRALSGTYFGLSTSHNLPVANLIIALDFPWRPYQLTQAIDRANRMGQENQVTAIYVKLDTGDEYNINSRNIDILKWAKEIIEEITGNEIPGMDLDSTITTTIEVTESNFSNNSNEYVDTDIDLLDSLLKISYGSEDISISKDDVSVNDVDVEPDNIVSRPIVFNKTEYVTYALKNNYFEDSLWYREMFSIVEKEGKYKYTEISNGIKYVYINDRKVKVDIRLKSSILKTTDNITLEANLLKCNNKTIITSIGLLIANSIFLEFALNGKVEYRNREFSHGEISNIIPSLMNKGVISIPEYHNYVNGISFSLGLNKLFVINITKKMLVAAPGMEEFKKSLSLNYDKEYGPKWKNDSAIALKFIAELKKYDNDYIKSDKAFGKILGGKILNNSRPRKFLAFGVENGFGANDKPVFVMNSLMDGYPKNKSMLAAMYNSARSGSFDRGAGTQEAGYMVKQMQKAVNNLVIKDGDCGDTIGEDLLIHKEDLWLYKNIYIVEKGMPVLKEDLSEYVGRTVRIRTPKSCKYDGSFCEICVGKDTARYKDGISLMVIAAIGVLLGIKMSSMHKASKELLEFDILDTIV